MSPNDLVAQGNLLREQDRYEECLRCYAQAFLDDPTNKHAWNNYGNVLREIGEPRRARPFLEHACALDPNFVTAQFNLAIADLLSGDYDRGWQQYEWRWHYEHLAGSKPIFPQPEWQGEDLKGRTILVISEQGFGDVLQFSRFMYDLHFQGARILFYTMPGLVPLFEHSAIIDRCSADIQDLLDFDTWIPIMSLPRLLRTNLTSLRHDLGYLAADDAQISRWHSMLGARHSVRIGVCWSGRRDSWANRYKSFALDHVIDLARACPQHQWISLQAEITPEEQAKMSASQICNYPGAIQNWADTAGLVHHQDLVLTMDTSVAHLAAGMGKPTWIPLTKFAVDWRWGTLDSTTPWYPSARLFRQPRYGDWSSVFAQIARHLTHLKI
jgi:hypothetical protein